jgi:hypothetical protein
MAKGNSKNALKLKKVNMAATNATNGVDSLSSNDQDDEIELTPGSLRATYSTVLTLTNNARFPGSGSRGEAFNHPLMSMWKCALNCG